MGALTIDPTKSHRLHSQPRTGQVTTRLADNPNSSSIPTNSVPVKLDIWGSIGDFISKAIPWVLTALGTLLAIGLAARAHEQSSSPKKPERDPHLQERETSFKAMLDGLSLEAKSLIDKTGINNFSNLQEYLSETAQTIRRQTQESLESVKNSSEYKALIESSERLKEDGGDLATSLSVILADLKANLNSESTRKRYTNALLDLRNLLSSKEFPGFLEMFNNRFPQATEKRETPRNIP
jgi:hypothetical protein